MSNIFLTPEEAEKFVNIYHYFSNNPDRYSYQEVSRKDFMLFIASIGDWLKTDDLEKVIEYLGSIAGEKVPPLNKNTLPKNLKELVEDYEKWLASQKAKVPQPDIKKQAEAIADKTDKIRVANPKITKLVYQAEQTKQERLRVEEQKETTHDKIQGWIEEERVKSITDALVRGGLTGEDIKIVTPIIQSQLGKFGYTVDMEQLEEIIASSLQKLAQKVSPEQQNTISTRLGETLVKPETILDVPQGRVQTFSVQKKTEPIPNQEHGNNKKKLPKEDSLYLLYRPQSYFQRVTGQFGFLVSGGKQHTSKEVLERAIFKLMIDYPNLYTDNSLEVRILRANISKLLAEVQASEAQLVPESKLQETLNLLGVQNFQTYKLSFENDSVSKQSTVVSLPSQNTLSAVQKSAEKTAKNTLAEVGAYSGIKLKRFLENPNLGWLRTTLAAVLGLGSFILPVSTPLRIIMFLVGGGIGTVQLGHSPKLIEGLFNFASRMPAGGSPLPNLSGLAGKGMPRGLIAAAIAIPIFLILITLNGISTSQGVFQTQNISVGSVVPESKYIGVTKTVEPSVYKSQLPTKATYAVTITAKEKSLTNISVSDKFSIFSAKGNPAPPNPALPQIPTTLGVGESKTITFGVVLGTALDDSVITNSATVTADVEEGPKGESTTRSASLIVGNPPTSCFVFDGDWPEENKAALIGVIGQISKSSVYMAGLCKGGVVVVKRGETKDWGGEVNGGNIITLYNKAFTNNSSLFYTMAHETGHVYGNRNGAPYTAFALQSSGEGYLPTYTLTKSQDEDFAESIGVYVVRKAVPILSGYNVVDMETKWPKHYTFVKDNIFGGFDGF